MLCLVLLLSSSSSSSAAALLCVLCSLPASSGHAARFSTGICQLVSPAPCQTCHCFRVDVFQSEGTSKRLSPWMRSVVKTLAEELAILSVPAAAREAVRPAFHSGVGLGDRSQTPELGPFWMSRTPLHAGPSFRPSLAASRPVRAQRGAARCGATRDVRAPAEREPAQPPQTVTMIRILLIIVIRLSNDNNNSNSST